MKKPFLTIGCATFQDFDGVYFTLQSLRLHHPEAMPYCELVVVDNDQSKVYQEAITNLLGWMKGDVIDARYVFAPEVVGTSAPRQRLFDEAKGEFVLCLDSHVMVTAGSIKRLISFYKDNPRTSHLYQGPMLYDDLRNRSTHFADQWRAEMWGTWDTDPRGDPYKPEYTENPFEIPACGLGLFSCRKDAWLDFNAKARGFGGEEFYIHEKFRQAGHKAFCLSWLTWLHRFGRPAGVKYPLTLWHKVRNYVIFHAELGIPFTRLHRHFILCQNDDGTPREGPPNPFPQHEWEMLLKDPLNPPEWPHNVPAPASVQAKSGCGGCGKGKVAAEKTLDGLYQDAAGVKSDINEHAPKLRELAAGMDHVTDFGHRMQVSTVALLAGQPKRMVSYASQRDSFADDLKARQGKTDYVFALGDSLNADIEPTDLLFIDTRHTGDHLYRELCKHHTKVRRRMAFHDTDIFGERGEDGGPGLLYGLRRFMREHPEWSVIYHTSVNYGLTVISKDPADKPELPSIAKMAWNYSKAKWAHWRSGNEILPQKEGDARLEVCATCPQRAGDRCSVCGCYLNEIPEGIPGVAAGAGRAWWAEQECPLGKWPLSVIEKGATA